MYTRRMRDIDGKLDGDLLVDDETHVGGMVTGTIRVVRGGALVLDGMCCRDLIIEPGGRAVVRGMVSHDVVNRGEIDVFGMILGELRNLDEGLSKVDAKAVIGPSQRR
jgi:hypothetical protein